MPHQIVVAVARELEDPPADGEDAPGRVADDEPGRRRRVVVVHQLEEEPESAAAALNGLVRKALESVEIDRPVLAVRADEERHLSIVVPKFGVGGPRALARGGGFAASV